MIISLNFQVSVILFNVSTFLPGDQNTDDCYHSTMAYAGTFNVRYFKSFQKAHSQKVRKSEVYQLYAFVSIAGFKLLDLSLLSGELHNL